MAVHQRASEHLLRPTLLRAGKFAAVAIACLGLIACATPTGSSADADAPPLTGPGRAGETGTSPSTATTDGVPASGRNSDRRDPVGAPATGRSESAAGLPGAGAGPGDVEEPESTVVDTDRYEELLRLVPFTELYGSSGRDPVYLAGRFTGALAERNFADLQDALHPSSPYAASPTMDPSCWAIKFAELGRFRGVGGWGHPVPGRAEVVVFLAPPRPPLGRDGRPVRTWPLATGDDSGGGSISRVHRTPWWNPELSYLVMRPWPLPSEGALATALGEHGDGGEWRVYRVGRTLEPSSVCPEDRMVLGGVRAPGLRGATRDAVWAVRRNVPPGGLLQPAESLVSDAEELGPDGELAAFQGLVLSDAARGGQLPACMRDDPFRPGAAEVARRLRIAVASPHASANPLRYSGALAIETYSVSWTGGEGEGAAGGGFAVLARVLLVFGGASAERPGGGPLRCIDTTWIASGGLWELLDMEPVPTPSQLPSWLEGRADDLGSER